MIKLLYKKCPYRYDCYYKGKKISKKKDVQLDKNSGELVFVEKSIYLGFCGCGVDNYKKARKSQKIITILYQGAKDDIMVTFNGSSEIDLLGVDSYSIKSIDEKENPKIIKNAKLFKALAIIIPLSILAIIFTILAVVLIKK